MAMRIMASGKALKERDLYNISPWKNLGLREVTRVNPVYNLRITYNTRVNPSIHCLSQKDPMTPSNASTLKSPLSMASTSTRQVRPASSWLARVGHVVLNAIIKSGESRARAALRGRNFY